MTFPEIITLIREGGSTLLLTIAVIGGFRGWYVFRWVHEEAVAQLRQERDEWRTIAKHGLGIAQNMLAKGP